MRLNKGGLICVGIYLCFLLLTLAAAYLNRDTKASGILVGLGSLPAGLVLGALPETVLQRLGPGTLDGLLVAACLFNIAIFYLFGSALAWAATKVVPRLNRLDDQWIGRFRRDDQ